MEFISVIRQPSDLIIEIVFLDHLSMCVSEHSRVVFSHLQTHVTRDVQAQLSLRFVVWILKIFWLLLIQPCQHGISIGHRIRKTHLLHFFDVCIVAILSVFLLGSETF